MGSLVRARPRVVSYIYACRPMPEVTRAPEAVCKRLTGISRVPHAVETPSDCSHPRGERSWEELGVGAGG